MEELHALDPETTQIFLDRIADQARQDGLSSPENEAQEVMNYGGNVAFLAGRTALNGLASAHAENKIPIAEVTCADMEETQETKMPWLEDTQEIPVIRAVYPVTPIVPTPAPAAETRRRTVVKLGADPRIVAFDELKDGKSPYKVQGVRQSFKL